MTDRLTPQREAEIATRDLIATKGPWGVYESGTMIDVAADLVETGCGYRARREIARFEDEPLDNDSTHKEWTAEEDWEQVRIDAEFVAHAREDVPALLAELAAVRAERDRYRSAWHNARTRAADGWADAKFTENSRKRWREAAIKAEARVAELEEARRLEWVAQGATPHTPKLCACGHSHHAHRVPDPHSCFAFGQTCPCEAYRQLPHAEAIAQLERNRRAAAERAATTDPQPNPTAEEATR
ncbi:hypothetical protein [Streptomyces prasinus]